MFQKLFIKNGVIKLNDCNFNIDDAVEDIYHELKEDLLQIELNFTYLIDVGWYPEFSKDGTFKILLIKDYDWDNPEEEYKTRNLEKLYEIVTELIKKITLCNNDVIKLRE